MDVGPLSRRDSKRRSPGHSSDPFPSWFERFVNYNRSIIILLSISVASLSDSPLLSNLNAQICSVFASFVCYSQRNECMLSVETPSTTITNREEESRKCRSSGGGSDGEAVSDYWVLGYVVDLLRMSVGCQ